MERSTTILVPLPAATADKVKKLSKVVNKRISESCQKAWVTCNGVAAVASDEAGDSLEFGYINHPYELECESVCTKLPLVKLDKKNDIHLVSLKQVKAFKPDEPVDIEAELNTVAEVKPSLNPDTFDRADKSQYWQWFTRSGDEMFLLRHGDATEVYEFDGATFEPKLINDGESSRAERMKRAKLAAAMSDNGGISIYPWTSGKAFWSPQGSFLSTTHTQGVRLWGGDDFHGVAKLAHQNVAVGIFSKNEDFVASWDHNKVERDMLQSRDADAKKTDEDDGKLRKPESRIYIHSVFTGECLAKLPIPPSSPHGTLDWPLVCFSHDSKFLAMRHPEGISVYSVPNFTEVTYTSNAEKINYLPFKNALFSWQPNSNTSELPVMAIWSASVNPSAPSRLTLLQIPTMQVLATRNIFSVDGLARTYWQAHGTHCALVTQVQKKLFGRKKVNQTQLDVFTMQLNRSGTLDVSWVGIDHDVLSVVWSDAKNRLAVLLANHQAMFFAVTSKGLEQCGQPLDIPIDINTVAWSPLGTHFVLAACGTEDPSGTIWFGSCNDENETFTVSILHKDEKPKLRSIDWDPSGRYVATSVSSPIGCKHAYRTEGARGYTIWSCQGKAVYSTAVDKLHRFQWRPHPLVHMDEKERNAVKQNIGKYSKVFEAEDSTRKNLRRQELQLKRRTQREEFKEAVQQAYADFNELPGVEEWLAAEAELAH